MQDRNTGPDPNISPSTGRHGAGHPSTIWLLVAVAAIAILAHKLLPATSPQAAVAMLRVESPDGTRNQIVTEGDCKSGKDRLWISDPDFTECIAYVVAQPPPSSASASEIAVVFFNGDVPITERSDQASITVRDREQAAARRFAELSGVTTIIMGRPGLMGSTGFHQLGGMREDAYVMSRALDLLRDRLGIRRLALAGQSGGARLIAQLMVLGRTDIVCAAMASGAYDTPGIKGGGTVRTNIWGEPGRRYLVPMHEVDKMTFTRGRRSFVIGDPQDHVASFVEQKAWADKLIGFGQHAMLVEAHGNGTEHHGLALAALTAAADCAKGVSDNDIRSHLETLVRR